MSNNIVVVLEVGHRLCDKGAKNSKFDHLNEYDINYKIAKRISAALLKQQQANLIILDGSISGKVKKINELDYKKLLDKDSPTIIQVSLHFNAYKGYTSNSSGCETLISDKKTSSSRLADLLLREFDKIGNTNRGIKLLSEGDRGYEILTHTKTDYAVLCEPLFIDAEEGELLDDPAVIDFLVDAYVSGITKFIKELTNAQSR